MNAAKIELSSIAGITGFLGTGNYSHRVVKSDRAPTEADYNLYLGTLWIANEADVWMLVSVNEKSATWYRIVTPEFSDVYEVVGNIMDTFNQTAEKAQEALDTANEVMEAKENGDLDGFNPIVELTPQTDGVMMKVTDAAGEKQALIPKGDKGDAGTIEIGTVTTGTAGSQASVVNVGTSDTAILNITIPRGDQGMGLTIKGTYDSYEEFIEAHPTGTEGENWQVKGEDGDVVYTWNATTGKWQSLGQLRGVAGPYFTPQIVDGVISWSNTEGLENPESYDLLGDVEDFILEQGYADGPEIQRLINNTLYQAIQATY